jgi:hypothetical protein
LNRDILWRLLGFSGFNIGIGFLTGMIPGWVPGLLILLISSLSSALLLKLIKPAEIKVILQEK